MNHNENPEHIHGRPRHYRRVFLFTVMCFLVGLWLISFTIIDFPWSDMGTLRIMVDLMTLALGMMMILLSVSLWKGII